MYYLMTKSANDEFSQVEVELETCINPWRKSDLVMVWAISILFYLDDVDVEVDVI